MGNWKQQYEKWHQFAELDVNLRTELTNIHNNKMELEDAFYHSLTFGTGGIRGVLGPGTNRMNIYTVRKAVKGLALYIEQHSVNYKDRGVVIAYDSRYMSKEFAIEAAKVLGVHGIKTYIFNDIHPTPLLSFAVRYLGTVAGIMITASHNPPQYNGLKVYNEQGSQITEDAANKIIRYIDSIGNELQIETLGEKELNEKNIIQWLKYEVDDAYLKQLLTISKFTEHDKLLAKELQIVFTPLHGTATYLLEEGLKQLSFSHLHLVEEQLSPDPEFSTVRSPNPEERQAFTKAIELGEKVNADILLATDPDADRLGVAVKDEEGNYQVLTGNQLGALLLDYILANTSKQLLLNARMIKTIVTSELGRAIASFYGVETIDTLTGFKYIGEKINEYDSTGETFIFGYEESYGYLISSFSRDKDAIQAAVLTCEIAEIWKRKGKTLLDALNELYERHGFYKEGIDSLTLEGIQGKEQINSIVDHFRNTPLKQLGSIRTLYKEDYLQQKRFNLLNKEEEKIVHLPKENVVKYLLEDNCWVCLRPSGTEPKIKWYYGAYGLTEEEVNERLSILKKSLYDLIVKEKQVSS